MPAAIAADSPQIDDSAPIGPSAAEEGAFLSAERENAGVGAAVVQPEADAVDAEKGELPPMEDLVQRIPVAARELMEDLFRARFVTVKRIPKSALKS